MHFKILSLNGLNSAARGVESSATEKIASEGTHESLSHQ